MSQFRKHLQEVEGKLTHPQATAMFEAKKNSGLSLEESIRGVSNLTEARKQDSGGYGFKKLKGQHEDAAGAAAVGGKRKQKLVAEQAFASYITDYFGGTISEDTTGDDILEAIEDLLVMEVFMVEYLNTDNVDESVEWFCNEYLNEYFGGTISEDVSDDDLAEAVEDLFAAADSVCEALDIDDELRENIVKSALGKAGKAIGGAYQKAKAAVTKHGPGLVKKAGRIIKGAGSVAADAAQAGISRARRETGV